MMNSQLWYKKSALNWNEALPIGNGRLAAMLYGGDEIDRIQFNEDTLWSGSPFKKEARNLEKELAEARRLLEEGKPLEAQKIVEDEMLGSWTQSYLPMGELQIQHFLTGDVYDYRRTLNIDEAISTVSYTMRNQDYKREYFASHPDDAFVVRYQSTINRLNLLVRIASPFKDSVETSEDGTLIMNGIAPSHVEPEYAMINPGIVYDNGMRFTNHLKVKTDGKVIPKGDELYIQDASEITFYLTGATSFNGYDKDPVKEGKDSKAICAKIIDAVTSKSYEEVKEAHVKDVASIMSTVDFQIQSGEDFSHLPTDERVLRFKDGNDEDQQLFQLLFQFGRYMMISASRPGTEPMHLQAIWNKDIRPVWSANNTININSQMSYWQAETTNMNSCHEPLFRLVKELSETGVLTAESYGCRGWASHHNIDIWRNTIATGEKNPKPCKSRHAFWPFGGVWLCQHLWDHYDFTGDKAFLDDFAYPILKGAALFCLDWVIKNDDGSYKTAPSTTPENVYLTPKEGERCGVSETTTMDIALIRNLFGNIIKATEVLGMDADLAKECQEVMDGLPPYKIGKNGQFMEWSEDYEEFEPGHRHQSHLVPLFPGDEITPDKTPDLADACAVSIKRRLENGGGYTGWSCAWIINLLARLRRKEEAYGSLYTIMNASMYTNMMDAHPPMQTDGNFGATSGMTEMLLHSHEGFIRPLPTVPAGWTKGYVKGLRARGAVTVDMTWDNSALTEITVTGDFDGDIKIYSEAPLKATSADVEVTADGNIYTVKGKASQSITLQV